jgi:hypothetical protein
MSPSRTRLLLTKEGRYDIVVTTSQSSVDRYGATLRRLVKSLTMKSRITAPMKAPMNAPMNAPTMPVPCTTRPASQLEIPPTTSQANRCATALDPVLLDAGRTVPTAVPRVAASGSNLSQALGFRSSLQPCRSLNTCASAVPANRACAQQALSLVYRSCSVATPHSSSSVQDSEFHLATTRDSILPSSSG